MSDDGPPNQAEPKHTPHLIVKLCHSVDKLQKSTLYEWWNDYSLLDESRLNTSLQVVLFLF